MSIIMGTATVPSNSTVAAFVVPAGLANFMVFQPTQAQTVFIGTSPNVSATSGMPVSATPMQQENYVFSKGSTYYATTGNGTASSFCFLISTGT